MKNFLIPVAALIFAATATATAQDAFEANKRLGRGINLGNALEAPSEGEWGLTLREEFFDAIKSAGFQHVRIPVRWATHTGPGPDYKLDPKFLARVDWAVDQALSRGLVAVLNAHHDDALYKEPTANMARFEATWRQLSAHYKGRPAQLYFELLNEPHDALTDELWQETFPKVLAIVRESHPTRPVIIGPGHWNNVDRLASFKLPENDRMLIGTFHYYNPFHFTHQGAEWAEGSAAWKGETWSGTPQQVAALKRDFAKAAKWSTDNKRPVYLGEFGAYSGADMASRATWTDAVAREAERDGFSWAYWEFASGFGAFDKETGRWRGSLRRALIPAESAGR